MSQDWNALAPTDRLVNEAVLDEWLSKPSWTLPEATHLIMGLDPLRARNRWDGFPVEEQARIIDTLRRAVGAPGKYGFDPISGKDEGDWRFDPKAVIRTAVYYKLEIAEQLVKKLRVGRTPRETSHGNADRYAKQRKEILMAGLAALAYRPDEFRTKEGRLINKDLAEFLEDSWPGEGAPQKAEAMAKLFGEVLKFGNWTDTKSVDNI